MKREFINFVDALIAAAPEKANELMSEKAKTYFEIFKEVSPEKAMMTDNGKKILKYLQDNPAPMYKAREVAEGLTTSSRSVSGGMRKLVSDGYVNKISEDPVIYAITEKGKNYIID